MHKASDFIFFYGREGEKGYLSQWSHYPFEAPLDSDGTLYRFETCEHWMMANKALAFGDKPIIQKIVKMGHSKEDLAKVKKLGRQVKNFDEAVWDQIKEGIVYQGNLHKFKAHRGAATSLLGTGEKILVEASRTDRVWGIGYTEANAMANFENWGHNLLGKALVDVREELRRT